MYEEGKAGAVSLSWFDPITSENRIMQNLLKQVFFFYTQYICLIKRKHTIENFQLEQKYKNILTNEASGLGVCGS